MKFLMIDAAAKTVKIEDHRNLVMAEQALGLNPRAVDHGSFQKGLGYVVFEFGLFDPPERQNYFAVGRSLIAGNCVAYAYDESGETIDVKGANLDVHFFQSVDDVKAAIALGSMLIRLRHTAAKTY